MYFKKSKKNDVFRIKPGSPYLWGLQSTTELPLVPDVSVSENTPEK